MLSITFCVSHKPQPVHTQAVFSLLVIVCALGLKGTTPGVEPGKELSLLVEERSSPESHSPWADTDGPTTCYIYKAPGILPNL